MVKRRLVQHGEATMMISLPAKWLKTRGLEKGDKLDVEEKENSLILTLDKERRKKETSIDLQSLEESSIRTAITNAYRLGYDKIKVNFKNKKTLPIIKELIEKNLLGFEIIKSREEECEIESVTEPSKEQFDNILSKIFLNTEELFKILENMLNGKKEEFEDIVRDIQKYDNFCKRVIVKTKLHGENPLEWTFHSIFIHGIREIFHLLRYLEKHKLDNNKYEIELFSKIKNSIENLIKAYKEKDPSLLEEVHKTEKEITYKKGYNSLKKANPIVIHHLITANKHFYLCNSPLMGMLMSEKQLEDNS